MSGYATLAALDDEAPTPRKSSYAKLASLDEQDPAPSTPASAPERGYGHGDFRDKYEGQGTIEANINYAKDYARGVWHALRPDESPTALTRFAPQVGAVETAANVATNIAAPLFALPDWALTKLGVDDPRNPEGTYAGARKKYVYEPRSQAGQQGTQLVSAVAKPAADALSLIGTGYADVAKALGASEGTQQDIQQIAPDVVALPALVKGLRAVRPSDSPSAQPDSIELGQSGGAAAARVDLANVSAPLKDKLLSEYQKGNLNKEAAAAHIEADSLPVPMKLTKGQATQDPVTLSQEMNSRAKNPELAHLYNEQNRQLIDNLDEIRANAAQGSMGMDHIQNGQALIDSYKSMDEPLRADISAKYKALEDANGGQFPVDGKKFVESADAALSKKFKGRYLPSQIAGDLSDIREGMPMTFEQFENLRTNLAAEARKADRAGDGNAAAAINIVRDKLESLPMEGASADLKALANEARKAAKARFDRLAADPAYRAAVDDSVATGEASPLADSFIDKFVVKGKKANLQQMRQNLGSDEAAQQTISAGAMNYLKLKSGVDLYTGDGNFSQAGYNRALSELTPKFAELFDTHTSDSLQSLGNVARKVQARPRGSFVNESNTFTAALGHHTANVAEGVVNQMAGGVPIGTFVRKKASARAEKKFIKETMEPGAGVALKDVLKGKKRK